MLHKSVILMGLAAAIAAAQGKAPSLSKPVVFTGMCDASAAILNDRGQLLVLNDEDQETTLLRFYDPQRGKGPVRQAPLETKALRLDPEEPEIDLEALARIENRLYLIGSHSRSKKGKERASRQRLFAVTWPIVTPSAPLADHPYTTLLKDLQQHLTDSTYPVYRRIVLDNGKAPEEGGVSIEGLAAAPDASLLVGFRSPVIRDRTLKGSRALLVALRNPADVFQGEKAVFNSIFLLDLGGDGIRDIVWDARQKNYLILSGAVGPGGTFGFYRWKPGQSQPSLRMRIMPQELGVDAAVAPEGLALNEKTGEVWVIFDEGGRQVNGEECKKSASQSFRAVKLSGL